MSNFAAMTRSKSLFILLIVLVVIGCLASWLTVRLILNHPCSASLRPTAGPIPGLATEKGPNIDLISGTIYGRHVFSLGLEEVTDLLGRPSFVSSPDIPGNGAHLAYAEKGLRFISKIQMLTRTRRAGVLRCFLHLPTQLATVGHFELSLVR